MAYHGPRSCPVCAWRANCVKRATSGGDGILNCPEFTEDVRLRRERSQDASDDNDVSDEDKA